MEDDPPATNWSVGQGNHGVGVGYALEIHFDAYGLTVSARRLISTR